MKKTTRSIVGLIVLVVTIIGLSGQQIIEVNAGTGDYYVKDKETETCPGGGNIVSYSERQRYGTVNGKVQKVKFYVYAKYTGSKKVNEIKCMWSTGATMRKCATMTLSTSVGKEYSFQASESSTWQSITSTEKYWSSTNGSKVECEASNFTIAPIDDLKGDNFWILSTAKVKLNGSNKYISTSSGC